MGAIRAATRRLDWVAIMRMAVAAATVALALAGLGLGPLLFVAVLALLLVAEAAVELTRAVPDLARGRA